MRFFQTISLLAATAAAGDITCNDSNGLDSKSSISLSKGCSDAEITDGDWLTVKCDVGAKLGTFGIHLNWCLTNNNAELVIQADGEAMSSCDPSQCSVTVEKGKSATMECHADGCRGTVDLDQAISFTGSYLKCFDHLGGGATDLKKRDLLGGDVEFHRRSLETRDDSVKDRFSGFCDSANFNKAQWDKASLGSQLELRSDEFYSDGPCGAGPYPSFDKYNNFMDALRAQVVGFSGYEGCDHNGCDDISPDDSVCHENDENPMWLMFMRSVKNYADFINAVRDGIYQGGDFAKDNATHVVLTFSSQVREINHDASNALVMLAGLLGALGTALPGAAGVASGLGSGIATVGIGLANMATTDDNAKRVQDMIQRGDAMDQRIDGVTKNLREYVNSWGPDLYADPVWFKNDAYSNEWYSDQTRSLPYIIKDGDFVKGLDYDLTAKVAENYGNNVKVGALAFTWTQEKVFIIKVPTSIGGTDPCDINWGSNFKNNATCIDDVAYLLHKTRNSPNNDLDDFPLDKAPAVDKLSENALPSEEDLIRAAIHSQDKGGYFKDWSTDILGDFPNVDATQVFNLPICDIGESIDSSSKLPLQKIIATAVGGCKGKKDQNGNDWPYSYEDYYYRY